MPEVVEEEEEEEEEEEDTLGRHIIHSLAVHYNLKKAFVSVLAPCVFPLCPESGGTFGRAVNRYFFTGCQTVNSGGFFIPGEILMRR
jgi:hypothetical protein